MKKYFLLLLLLILLALTIKAEASPFVVCDPSTGITSYNVTAGSWFATASVAAQSDGSLKLDAVNAPVGTTNMTVAACITDPTWGVSCSATVPFVLTRPSAPATPKNTKLTP